MKKICLFLLLAVAALTASAQRRQVKLSFLETSDVHGNYLPYDFINGHAGSGSLARIYTHVKALRQSQGDSTVVLLDNGDILQGQPTAYYYNFIDTVSPHLCAEILNYMRYDAATMGNHDVEPGHAVYDRWTAQCKFPVLCANAVRNDNGRPYWPPYTIIERQGVRIAVFGMLTPGIPLWLPENLWQGMHFADMVETARQYMPQMRKEADLVVGVFHSGIGSAENTPKGAENASIAVAKNVPGFDLIFCGHDHRRADLSVVNVAGDTVRILNPANDAQAVAQGDMTLTFEGDKLVGKHITGRLVEVSDLEPDAAFVAQFAKQYNEVKNFTNSVIGTNETEMATFPAFFGPSAFIDFIHTMQLSISGADISFAAPLAFDARIPKGEIHVRDMFNLYRYENMLYVMKLTGQEIKDFLEYSYAGWTEQMHSADDHLLLFRPDAAQLKEPWQRFATPSFNFDSAAGIYYTVDVTKPRGSKISISRLADGRPFSLTETYRCAVNSYRGNGGGKLLTEGSGINKDKLKERIVWSTDKDLRYYLLMGIREKGRIAPAPLNQWKFIPEKWVKKARAKDEKLLK